MTILSRAFQVLTLFLGLGGLGLGLGEPGNFSPELEEIRARHELPGLVALAIRGGEVQFQGAVGRRRVDDATPIEMGDKLHLGSCGKAITATMVATLIEEGELTWDTTIAGALPELAESIHPGFHAVTILQLLQHQGGIAERRDPPRAGLLANDLAYLEGDGVQQRWEAVPKVLERAPATRPGEGMEYSNYGYMTAGTMAETLLDTPWEELMLERVFEPLGMDSAGFCQPGTTGVIDQPRGHIEEAGKLLPQEPGVDPDLPLCIAPAGLMHCSMEDWSKFIQAHLEGARGRDNLLQAATFKRLQTPPSGAKYACGWGVEDRDWSPGPVLSHNGSNGAWFSVVWASPSLNLAVMAVCNSGQSAAPGALDEACALLLRKMDVLEAETETETDSDTDNDTETDNDSDRGCGV